jgi:lipoprotein
MKKIYLLLATVAMLMTSCSSYTLVNSEIYNGADLAAYKTFRIVSPADGDLPPGMEMVTYYNITAAIREQMVERGYTESAQSDLLVNIGLTVKKEITTAPAIPPGAYAPPPYAGPYYGGCYPYFIYPRSYYWPAGYYANAQVITGIYREGVLTMDMVNIGTKVPLYSASVATIMDNGDTNFRDLKGIAEAVQVLFSKYPVPVKPPYRK